MEEKQSTASKYHIPLHRDEDFLDHVRKTYHYDPKTGKIYYKKNNKEITTVDSTGYIRLAVSVNKIRKNVRGQHIAYFLYYDVWPATELDHIDRNKTNNQITNIRSVTRSQNNKNRGKYTFNNNGIKTKHVFFNKKSGKYIAQVPYFSKRISLGYFETEDLARQAIEKWKIEIEKCILVVK